MTSQPPFALFVLAETIDTEYLNRSLRLARDWDANAAYELWVATNSYADMPKAPGKRQDLPEGTKPPLEDSFNSPWIGNTIEDCAKWLHHMPNDSAIQKEYFAAMDQFSREDDTVLECRIRIVNGAIEVDYYPLSTADISMYMISNRGSRFEEAGRSYQAQVKREGKPDRSQGGPFH